MAFSWKGLACFSPDLRLFQFQPCRPFQVRVPDRRLQLMISQNKPNSSSSSRNQDTSIRHDDLFSEEVLIVDLHAFTGASIQKPLDPPSFASIRVDGPVASDVIEYLNRIGRFNTRKENPTSWEIELHTGPDFFERMLRERPGNVVILTGRNRPKIDRIQASVKDGLHVLADKPWI